MLTLDDAVKRCGLDPTLLQVFGGTGDERIYYLQTPGDAALEQWQRLRDLVPESGYWPVIMGDEESFRGRLYRFEHKSNEEPADEEDPQVDSGQASREYSALDIIEQAIQLTQTPISDEDRLEIEDFKIEEDLPRGEWPENPDVQTKVYATTDILTGEYLLTLYMGFVPTKFSWQVPAFLRFEASEYELTPLDHCIELKRWESIYGTEIVAVTDATIEMIVAQPPQEREQALELAIELYAYCPDIVSQGVETIDALAAGILNGRFWYFWWD